VESWRPNASLEALKLRAHTLAKIREFFAERQVLEVETPTLCRAVDPDPHIDCFQSQFNGPGFARALGLFLRSSPEFHMKRLLCAGSGSIYQISKCFRQGELGALHQPEFTMLEWYRTDFDQNDLVAEMKDLLMRLAPQWSWHRCHTLSYADAFLRYVQVDPLQASAEELNICLQRYGVQLQDGDLADEFLLLDCLMSHIIQPQLGREGPLFLTDFPARQAALSQLNPLDARVSQRFELFVDGVELANGFCELRDATELQRRLEQDCQTRRDNGQTLIPLDRALIAAHQSGLPQCAGVALGFDRLMMLISGVDQIDQVLAFSEFQ